MMPIASDPFLPTTNALRFTFPMSLAITEAHCAFSFPSTYDRLVHQDVHDPRKFAIVERFEHESSQRYHLENPYWATFNPAVEPWLAKPIEILRFNEL